MNQIVPINPSIANVEAEQQVLGALLLNPEALDVLAEFAKADLFSDPVHQEIFRTVSKRIREGQIASPVSLRLWAENDEGVKALGGAGYLVRLAGCSIAPKMVRSYGAMLDETRRKRDLLMALEAAKIDLLDDEQGSSEIASRLEAALLADPTDTRDGPVSMMRAVTNAVEDINETYKTGTASGTPTGIEALDDMLAPMKPGQVIIMAGRPSMGKSAVALSVALNVARAGGGVAISTLEMSPEDMAERALSEATARRGAAVHYTSMGRPGLPEMHMRSVAEAAKDVAELPIHFLPIRYRDVGALYGGVRRIKAIQGVPLKLLVVDYLQILSGEGKSVYERITNISIALKSLAMQLQVPILALSQLSRGVESREDKRPMLSDLRDSGQIEQDADAVLFCYRNEYYLEREQPSTDDLDEHAAWQAAMAASHNKLELILAKQRKGPIGTAHVMFNPAINRVWDR